MADSTPSLDGAKLNALPDIPDHRDRWYEPTLAPLRPKKDAPEGLTILDQGQEGSCTGFGLAAVVNLLNRGQGRGVEVSARMLYEMAKRHDEWPGEAYSGSSCRGAIKGWYHMGVCRDELWRYQSSNVGHLTVARAKDARAQTTGAYYRINKNIVDMHAALNEVEAIYVSAQVHRGWSRSATRRGEIPLTTKKMGGHAFAIVGYDEKGFLVQNSWGPSWGRQGIARWLYEDWTVNVRDAWVVQLALPTPQLYSRRHIPSGGGSQPDTASSSSPRRDEIAGHFVHIDDGAFHDTGTYWSNLADVKETAQYVAESKYKHLLIYGHGGLNSVKASARRIAAMRDTFKKNGIYPFHFMYDTGLLEEVRDIVLGKKGAAEDRAGGLTDWTDRLLERATRRPGRALWREMKSDAALAFRGRRSPGAQTLEAFLNAFAAKGVEPKQIHLVGHSTGAILHAHLVTALAALSRKLRIDSVSLLAPAIHMDLFRQAFVPHLKAGGFGLNVMNVYNLTDRLEQDDNVGKVYRKSLLYLVSRAFEEQTDPPAPILGMQKYSGEFEKHRSKRLNFYYSNGIASSRDRTNSSSHGGFDNDPATMNDVLKAVLKAKPSHPFTEKSLEY